MTMYYFKDQMGEGRYAEQEGENRLPAAKQDHHDKVDDVGGDDDDHDKDVDDSNLFLL